VTDLAISSACEWFREVVAHPDGEAALAVTVHRVGGSATITLRSVPASRARTRALASKPSVSGI
jgi:hypothetical protein